MKKNTAAWQSDFKACRITPDALKQVLSLKDAPETSPFPLRAPQAYLDKINKQDANDPLLKQILPIPEETLQVPEFSDHPLKEDEYNPVPGLIHKYKSRVLLTVTEACAIHCRYCFRRHFPYAENNPGRAGFKKAFEYIARHEEVFEVILSGGDPLSAPDDTLRFLVENIAEIPHIQTVRFHTRTAVAMPSRVTPELITAITGTRLRVVLVTHCNHPNELGDDVKTALQLFINAGITLLNQSVLLKGVNDDVATLCDLSRRLFACGVTPYYCHLLDRVNGSAHFEVSKDKAKKLIAGCREKLPGYLVPRLAKEEPGRKSKTIEA